MREKTLLNNKSTKNVKHRFHHHNHILKTWLTASSKPEYPGESECWQSELRWVFEEVLRLWDHQVSLQRRSQIAIQGHLTTLRMRRNVSELTMMTSWTEVVVMRKGLAKSLKHQDTIVLHDHLITSTLRAQASPDLKTGMLGPLL